MSLVLPGRGRLRHGLSKVVLSDAAGASPCGPAAPELPREPLAFVWRYVRQRPLSFGILAAMVVLAASAAVVIQIMMKLLVDGMAGGPAQVGAVWTALAT